MNVSELKILLTQRLLAVNDIKFLKKLELLFDKEASHELSDAHKQILNERLAAVETEAQYGKSWEEVKKSILN